MKELTKAEEQVMKYLWKLKKAYLKGIVAYPDPKSGSHHSIYRDQHVE